MPESEDPTGPGNPEPSRVPFLAKFIATGFYSGFVPWASGTIGTVAGLLIYLIPGVEQPAVLVVLIVTGFLAGVPSAAIVARSEGHRLTRTARALKTKFQPEEHAAADPSIVVIDEIVGTWVALLFLPKTWLAIIIAFLLFRILDIVKPFPARQLERIPNGWGIMLDDVVAGVYANVLTHITLLGIMQIV